MKRLDDLNTTVIEESNKPCVGQYAVSSFNTRPWASRPVKKERKRQARRKKKRITYPIFSHCVELSDDPFWKEKFEKASFGKFPKGFSFNGEALFYKKGNKNDALFISKDPAKAYDESLYFFRTYGKIMSDLDRKQQARQIYRSQIEDQLKEKTWTKISKRQKEILVYVYADDLRNRYELDVFETRQLKDLIIIGIFLGIFNRASITLEDGFIKNIDGLIWDPKTRTFNFGEGLKPNTSKSSSKSKRIEPSVEPRYLPLEYEKKDMDFYGEWNRLLKKISDNRPQKKDRPSKSTVLDTTTETFVLPEEDDTTLGEDDTTLGEDDLTTDDLLTEITTATEED